MIRNFPLHIVLLVYALLLLIPSQVYAAVTPEQVEYCVNEVRSQSNSPSPFDAYVQTDGTIKTFGTEREFFLFKKCYSENYKIEIKDLQPDSDKKLNDAGERAFQK